MSDREKSRPGLALRRRLILLFVFSLILGGILSSARTGRGAGITTVILVRHAERNTDLDDGDLTEAGKKRAEVLLHPLKNARITAIYTSQFLRTKRTVEPLAKWLGLGTTPIKMIRDETKPNNISPESIEEVHRAIQKHRGETILIAGHSNTIPEIMKRLGVKDPPQIGSDDFDDLFVVATGDWPKLIHLHYGEGK